VRALLALVVVTAVWGVTFVQVKDALELYPLFAFLAVRFAIASVALAPGRRAAPPPRRMEARDAPRRPARPRLRAADRGTRPHERLEHGLHHRSLRRLHPTLRLRALSDQGSPGSSFSAWGSRSSALPCWPASASAEPGGDALVLAGAAAFSLQIALMERYAPRYDAVAFTFIEMLAAFVGFAVIAVALGAGGGPARLDGVGARSSSPASSRAHSASSSRHGRNGSSRPRAPALAFAMEPGLDGDLRLLARRATASAPSAGRAPR
jgi:hypothetical protein